ncbi:MAG: DUF499 domain-containing protein [Theionarchaea archaeon]|nr:DUF499 domain-containing protein [Theionarchaea archaeon]
MLAVKLRKEIVNAKSESQLIRNINPVISWDNFRPPEGPKAPAQLGGLEGDPEWFFSHTYPTSVIREILRDIKEKIESTGPGVFPLDGYLGSGKSHVLLTLYHIFRHTDHADRWFQEWGIDFPRIRGTAIIPIPLQSVSYRDLWSPLFQALGKDIGFGEGDWPRSNQIKKAIGEKNVLMLIDEIDNWYDAKNNQEKARVRGFLQGLSESSEDSRCQFKLVTTFLGISSDVKVLRDIVARPRGGSSIIMQRSDDIFGIVRFRLFKSIDQNKIDIIIPDYLRTIGERLRKKGLDENSYLKDELKKAYPFHPSFLRTLSHLRVRQMLVMLAKVVMRKIDEVDLIISSDLDDDILRDYLHSANPKVVDAYFEDIGFVQNTKEVKDGIISFELARAILITSMLGTTEAKKGADVKDIVFGCGPKYKVQDIDDTISFLEKWTRLKRVEEDGTIRYVITTELPVAVKIERKSELVSSGDALQIIEKLVERKASSEIKGYRLIHDPSEISNDKRLKILTLLEKPIDVSYLYPPEFTNRNTLYLLYPSYSLKSDETIKLAKRIIASDELADTEGQEKPFKEFHEEYMKHITRQIDNAGWRGFRWFRKNPRDKPAPDERTITSLRDVDRVIRNYASKDLLEYFLNMILEENDEISVRDLKERLYRLEGAPMLLRDEDLLSLLVETEKIGQVAIKTKQGRILYRKPISPQTIGNEDVVKKPLEIAIPPTSSDIAVMVRDKKRLPFRKFAESYPFIDDKILETVYISSINTEDGIFALEENRIISRPSNVKLSALVVVEEAAEILEPLILKIVNERIATKVTDLSIILKETHGNSGITDDLVLMAGDNLEIGTQVHILRGKDSVVIQLPEEKLTEEVKKKVFIEVEKEGEFRREPLVEEVSKIFPTEKKIINYAIASLIDENRLVFDKDKSIFSLPKGKGPSRELPKKRIIFREEGTISEILKRIEKEVEDADIMEDVRIEVAKDLTARELMNLLKKAGDLNIRFLARRKEI